MSKKAFRVGSGLLGLLVIANVILSVTPANAATTAFGRRERYGYFKNDFGHAESPYRDGGGPVIDNGGDSTSNNAMPTSINGTNDKGAFIAWLKSRYNGKDNGKYGHPTWDSAGVAFIVNTMLGRNAPGDRSLDSSEWNELEERISNPDITIDPGTYKSKNFGDVDTFFQYDNKDVAWYNNPDESGSGIAFRYKGKIVYVILYECANPLGDLPGIPPYNKPDPTCKTDCGPPPDTGCKTNCTPPPDPDPVWSIGASASASLNPASSRVEWTHSIRNNGPDPTTATVGYGYQNANGETPGPGSGSNGTWPTARASGDSYTFGSSASYGPDDAGKNFCRTTTANPGSGTGGTSTSAPACVTIPYDYNLHPKVTVNGGTIARVEPGSGSVAVDYSITNDGPTRSAPTAWQLTRCQYAPGATAPNPSTETSNGQTAAQTFGGLCTATGGNGQYPVGTAQIGSTADATVGELPVGTRVCYVMSVNPPSQSTGGWRHSVLACIAVLKSPKVQAWGGDIKAGIIRTRAGTNAGGKTYGSWAEYGIFNYGSASGMGSASVFAGGCSANCMDITRLTFANTTGNRFMDPIDEGYAKAYAKPDGGAIGGSFAGLASGSYARGGNLAIGGNVPAGLRTTVTVTGDLTINADIDYPDTYGSVQDVPRVVIVVDGDIIVNANVGRIDAWLISKKTLYTCSDDTAPMRATLSVGKCQNQLVFNGPVYVKDTRLSRTFGADADSREQAAEVFNLRPDIFISSYAESGSATGIQTVYEKELPPRY